MSSCHKSSLASSVLLCIINKMDSNHCYSLAGAGMQLFETPSHPEYVDVVGASDDVESGMCNLPIATYCCVVTSSRGVRCLGVFPNCIGYEKGKSILSANQSAAFGHQVQERPRRYGGAQKIITRDGFVFKLLVV